ncbi:hypothetical protein ACV4VW_31505, partial [Pseudomonas aeruginosa]
AVKKTTPLFESTSKSSAHSSILQYLATALCGAVDQISGRLIVSFSLALFEFNVVELRPNHSPDLLFPPLETLAVT